MLAQAVRTAFKRSAPDAFGRRYQDIIALLPSNGSNDISTASLSSSNTWPEETFNIPEDVRRIFRIIRLVALDKGNEAVRPIAIGNTLRRLCTQCIAFIYKKHWKASVGPLQYAIGTEIGRDKLVQKCPILS